MRTSFQTPYLTLSVGIYIYVYIKECIAPTLEILTRLAVASGDYALSFTPAPAGAAHYAVASTDRRNTLRKLLCWGLVLQGLAGAFVQLPGNCA
jgi:hypothetical protein